MARLFGTDGIRGKANQYPMDGHLAFSVGQAVADLFGGSGRRSPIVIGKDPRISSDMLESALAAGIVSMGKDAYLAGIFPTPGVALLASHRGADAGIVISASHNPYQDNGIKIFSGRGYKLSDQEEEALEKLVFEESLSQRAVPPKEMGMIQPMKDARAEYISFLKKTLPSDISIKDLKIVMDTANGATCEVAPKVFAELGAQVDVIHNSPDGININDHCGSQHTHDLQKRVLEIGAHIGLAFDGDGDRLVAIDEKGDEISGDQILFVCAHMYKDCGALTNNTLVSTVMSNIGLTLACRREGMKHFVSQVGDRNVSHDMRRLGVVVGGENSGHLIFADYHTTGDGILAAIQLVVAMIRKDRPLSELAATIEMYPQRLVNVEVGSKPEISSLVSVTKMIKKVERDLGDQGRVLVRYSGTENLCRVMVEGPSDQLAETYSNQIAHEIKAALS
ncbi:MAG: phosphoglucosamine mutase [Thermodesulfobacteriota bacterium]|nr:phosphoglucosamine mutase [Thermodesulfobacteriota bacterium]